jgi:hypothetical protein
MIQYLVRKLISYAESVQGEAVALEGVDDVHDRHRLPARLLRVGHGVADDFLEEDKTLSTERASS